MVQIFDPAGSFRDRLKIKIGMEILAGRHKILDPGGGD
jgi:hypothetical protein